MRVLDIRQIDVFKPIIRLAAAALVTGLIVLATSAAPKANVPDNSGALIQPSAKGVACSQYGWPHFEQNCQFDARRPNNEARIVRVIALR
jgi:hypothetical protein